MNNNDLDTFLNSVSITMEGKIDTKYGSDNGIEVFVKKLSITI